VSDFASRALALFVVISVLSLPATAQRQGEYLSPGEQDLIRDAQEIGPRAKVFVRLAGRRVLALTGGTQDKKDEELFGPLPSGTQAELLDEYRMVLEEYMNKIDDHYERKGNSKDMGSAMRLTVDGLEAHLKALAAYRPQLKDERAVHFYGKAVEAAEIVLEGVRPLASTDDKK
jgi:hypothetical protein